MNKVNVQKIIDILSFSTINFHCKRLLLLRFIVGGVKDNGNNTDMLNTLLQQNYQAT